MNTSYGTAASGLMESVRATKNNFILVVPAKTFKISLSTSIYANFMTTTTTSLNPNAKSNIRARTKQLSSLTITNAFKNKRFR